MKKLIANYEFDIRDIEQGKLIKAIKWIKEKYAINDQAQRMYHKNSKIRDIETYWTEDNCTYIINVYEERKNSWRDNLAVGSKKRQPRKDILDNRNMSRDVESAVNECTYGNYVKGKTFNNGYEK